MLTLSLPLVLASRSPRRRELLKRLGLTFSVQPSDLDEVVDEAMGPAETVEDLALQKARHVANDHPAALVLGADTIVVIDDRTLGKPRSHDEAVTMLRRLSGNTHSVYSGIGLVHIESGRAVSAHERTDVTFGALNESEIESYVRSGSPMDKAGGYGIQDDAGALLIDRVEGDYYNVVGLPLRRLYLVMREHFGDVVRFGVEAHAAR